MRTAYVVVFAVRTAYVFQPARPHHKGVIAGLALEEFMRLQEQTIAGMTSIQNLLGEALVAMRTQTEVMEASVYLIMFCGDHRYALLQHIRIHYPHCARTHACSLYRRASATTLAKCSLSVSTADEDRICSAHAMHASRSGEYRLSIYIYPPPCP